MINIEAELFDKVESEILKWNEEGIYAISFLVDSNEAYEYRGFENASMWTISYNTESDCDGAGLYDEERWNYAFWRQDEIPIISLEESDIYSEMLFDWYEENGITNIGEEDSDEDYDEDGRYMLTLQKSYTKGLLTLLTHRETSEAPAYFYRSCGRHP